MIAKRAESGVTIGGYELVRRLGRGNATESWLARRVVGREGPKFVAIKLVSDRRLGDERCARLIRAEARYAAILDHANIVQVFEQGEEDGRSYVAMEWVDGLNLLKLGSVLSLIEDEQRRCRVVSYVIGQLLVALDRVHCLVSREGDPLGIVHCDVSPKSVLVSNRGDVKLSGFGHACSAREANPDLHARTPSRYMSPEQLQGETIAPIVDLYAVGALLHELLDGKKFRGDAVDERELIGMISSGDVPPMTRIVPAELDHLRLRLLDPDPRSRVQTAREALTLLERFSGHGDARKDLAALCNDITGVLRPRPAPSAALLDSPLHNRAKGMRFRVAPSSAEHRAAPADGERSERPSASRDENTSALVEPRRLVVAIEQAINEPLVERFVLALDAAFSADPARTIQTLVRQSRRS